MDREELLASLLREYSEVSNAIRKMEDYTVAVNSDKEVLKSDVYYSMLLSRKRTLKEIIELIT